ncbi:hypothetical protein C2G38_2094569 [Gigaspora rosea]|uniref:Membrane anchor Opy2 N-terminal domain-containing protein n=1 Tax=Gigaspora rosea TaxID=44941 RepID=A0A397UXJ8_9GLOM|nr:hypothetical protein C2G38_2094569 [Gigaspora rosea]
MKFRMRIFLVFLTIALALIATTNARRKNKLNKFKHINPGGPNKSIPTTTPPAKIAGETPTTITPTATKSCRISCPACATATPIHCMIACSTVCD